MRREDVPRLLDDNMIASTDVRLVTQVMGHAGARRPTRGRDRLGNGDPFLQFLEPVLHHMDFSPGVLAGTALVR